MSEWFYKVSARARVVDGFRVHDAKFGYQPYWRGSDEWRNQRMRAHIKAEAHARKWEAKPDEEKRNILIRVCDDNGRPYSDEVFLVPFMRDSNGGLMWSANPELETAPFARMRKVGGRWRLQEMNDSAIGGLNSPASRDAQAHTNEVTQ